MVKKGIKFYPKDAPQRQSSSYSVNRRIPHFIIRLVAAIIVIVILGGIVLSPLQFAMGKEVIVKDSVSISNLELLAMTGEQFDQGDDICGVVINVRGGLDKVSIWTKSAANDSAQMSIGKHWKEFIGYNDTISFIFHERSVLQIEKLKQFHPLTQQPAPQGFIEYTPAVVPSSSAAGHSKDEQVSPDTVCYGSDNTDSETAFQLSCGDHSKTEEVLPKRETNSSSCASEMEQ